VGGVARSSILKRSLLSMLGLGARDPPTAARRSNIVKFDDGNVGRGRLRCSVGLGIEFDISPFAACIGPPVHIIVLPPFQTMQFHVLRSPIRETDLDSRCARRRRVLHRLEAHA
jgi:hypothetical protein